MTEPMSIGREALLKLFRELGGPLVWTGPIPYDALAARYVAADEATTACATAAGLAATDANTGDSMDRRSCSPTCAESASRVRLAATRAAVDYADVPARQSQVRPVHARRPHAA